MVRISVPPALLGCVAVLLLSGCASKSESDLVWHQEDSYRWAELPEFGGERAGFTEIAPRVSGIDFVNTLDEESLVRNRHYMNGSGVAVGDVDGDGWADLYFARLDGPNVLYRNLGGWEFEDITDLAGVAAPDRYSTGAVFADIDGDRDLDLLVTAMGGPNAAYLNDGTGRFTEVTDRAGLTSDRGSTTMALSDVDGDGDLDLYVSNYKARSVSDIYPPSEHTFERTVLRDGSSFRIAPEFEAHYELLDHAGGLLRVERAERNQLLLNDGAGRFTPISADAFANADGDPLSAVPEDWTLTARFQDVDGDGAPDLYVCNDFHSPDQFWLGNGAGGFRAVSPLAVRKTSFSTMSVDFSDIDRDGDLDFFLTDMLSREHGRRQTQVGLTIPMTTAIGEIENRPQAVQNTLFLNRGDSTYAEIARLAGVAASDWTWSGLFLDVDLDGYEDLLLATGHLYDVIDKDAQMTEMLADRAPRGGDFRRQILDYPPLPLRNVAFRNRRDLSFEFMDNGWGLGQEEDVSNALAFGDFDNDGDLDAVVNRLNAGAGLFRNDAEAPRIAVRLRGAAPNTQAVGSVIRVSGGGLPIQEKEVISGGQYLSGSDPLYSFAASMNGGKREASGAGKREHAAAVQSDEGAEGTGSPDDDDPSLSVEVRWRSGIVTRIEGIVPNRIIEIYEPGAATDSSTIEASDIPIAAPRSASQSDSSRATGLSGSSSNASENSTLTGTASPPLPAPPQLFEDVSSSLRHAHQDAPFDDFADQALLRARLSQSGPAAAWADFVNGGGGSIIIGTGRTGRLTLFGSNGSGGFVENPIDLKAAIDDVAGIVVMPLADGGSRIFAGVGNYEQQYGDSSWIDVVEVTPGGSPRTVDRLPFGFDAVGPLALADIDGDGDLDLFAGGRLAPSRYPAPASSRIYINDGERFRYDAVRSEPFDDVGMVSGTALGDLDGDGDADVALAVQWGPLRYFENDGTGRFSDQSGSAGFAAFSGWWNGISMGDFDSDGKLDLVATNFGWNGIYERLHAADRPIRLYYGDFDSDGAPEPVEAYYDPGLGDYAPRQGLTALSQAMPYVSQRVRSFREYSTSTLSQILGPRVDRAEYLEANTLSQLLLLNEGAGDGTSPRFSPVPLPLEAQFSAAFSPVVGDFDGDGREDVFLSQNLFALAMEIPRQDAGRGLLLLGDGSGDLMPVSAREAGIAVYGEQRASASGDLDGDARADLLVTQNGAETRLYRNTAGSAGLRVILRGPSGNPAGVGTILRLKYSDGSVGPARLVSAGAGYWSQNALVQVLGVAEDSVASEVQVTWPGGQRSEIPVDAGATEVTVSFTAADP